MDAIFSWELCSPMFTTHAGWSPFKGWRPEVFTYDLLQKWEEV